MNAFKTLSDDLRPRERMEKRGTARGMRPEELVAASKVLRIPLLDHIIIGRDWFVSLREDDYVSDW